MADIQVRQDTCNNKTHKKRDKTELYKQAKHIDFSATISSPRV